MSEVQTVNKKKSPNFSNLEEIKLIELIEWDKNIIENKKTDNVSTRGKEKCWMKITKKFNNNCISVHRDSLKNCWDNLKKNVNILLKFAVNFFVLFYEKFPARFLSILY